MSQSPSPSIFIAASDTGAGKTHVTALLTRALRRRGAAVRALKPVGCGRGRGHMNGDVRRLLRAQGMDASQAREINLYDFAAAAAPQHAAAAEGMFLEPGKLLDWCARNRRRGCLTLIEGVGGLMVPLAPGFLVSDWLSALSPPLRVLLVVRARLGGINHALLTLDKLVRLQHPPSWIVVNDADGGGGTVLQQHLDILASRLPAATRLLVLPHQMRPSAAPLKPLLTDLLPP